MLLDRSPSPLHLATPPSECDRFPFSSLYSYYYDCHCSHLHLPRPPAFLPNCTSSSSFSSSSSCPFLSVRPRHPPRPPALPLACRPYCASLAPILHPGWQIDCASIAIIIAHRHRNHPLHHRYPSLHHHRLFGRALPLTILQPLLLLLDFLLQLPLQPLLLH